MVRLTRKNMKVFAANASNNGVFGSLEAGNPTVTNDVEQIQGLTAWGDGWNAATLSAEKLPPLEEFQGVQYVTTYQQAYLMQEGMPEWAATVTYYKGSLVKKVTTTGFQIYNSLTDDNTNNQLSDTSNWKLVMDSDNLYALDSTVVHKAGAETITGIKTFSNDFSVLANSIKISSTGTNCNYPLSFQLPSFTKGDTPANNVIAGIDFYGSARTNFSDRLSNIDFMVDTSKNSSIDIRAYDCSTSASTDAAGLSVHYDADGKTYALCPAPSLASNASNYSKQIVNISYLNGASSGVVHLTGDETITGLKTIRRSGLRTTFLDLVNSSITNGVRPSENVHNRIYFSDSNGDATACIFNDFDPNGTNALYLQALLSETITQGTNRSLAHLGIVYPASGNPYATAPASDVNGSIVTTKSHGENYVEFGNGYILQKGTFTYASSSGTVDVPLDKTMTTTSYCVMICLLNETRANVGAVTARATNKFTYKSFNYESTGTAMYIVFGK